jgi:hypothetical protein
MEEQKEREPVLAPVPKREPRTKGGFPGKTPEQPEVEVREMPRRWYVY